MRTDDDGVSFGEFFLSICADGDLEACLRVWKSTDPESSFSSIPIATPSNISTSCALGGGSSATASTSTVLGGGGREFEI